MRKLIKRDKENRIKYLKHEPEYYFVKSLLQNDYLCRNKAFKRSLKDLNHKFGGNYVKIVNCCILTGRTRGIHKRFKMYRLKILEELKQGKIEGLIKIDCKK